MLPIVPFSFYQRGKAFLAVPPAESSLLPHWPELGHMAPTKLCESNFVAFSLSDEDLGRKRGLRIVIERPA